MSVRKPPGWPDRVPPPGSPGFEPGAVSWLLAVIPPGYRDHSVLRRHPAALAALARDHLAACLSGVREGYRTARTELGTLLPPHALDDVLEAYRAETRRLRAEARSTDLLLHVLCGSPPQRATRAGGNAHRGPRPARPAGPRPGSDHDH